MRKGKVYFILLESIKNWMLTLPTLASMLSKWKARTNSSSDSSPDDGLTKRTLLFTFLLDLYTTAKWWVPSHLLQVLPLVDNQGYAHSVPYCYIYSMYHHSAVPRGAHADYMSYLGADLDCCYWMWLCDKWCHLGFYFFTFLDLLKCSGKS